VREVSRLWGNDACQGASYGIWVSFTQDSVRYAERGFSWPVMAIRRLMRCLQFAALALEAPETQVVWATRLLNQRPCVEVSSDPLPERQRVASMANQLAARPPS
jgi:hypothetical protein